MKRKKPNKLLIALLLQYAGAILVGVLMLFYQDSFKPLAIINAMQVSGALLVIIGWFVYVNHHGVFDIVFHGLEVFWKNLFNRRVEKTLYDKRMERKKMPRYLFLSLWINGLIIIIVSYIIFYAFLN